MSESSKPDGTDPRIMQKEGKIVYVASTVRQSKARKYHEEGCDSLDRIVGGPKQVDIAVAKWKGMKPCSHCIKGENDSRKSSLTGQDVDRIRRALVNCDVVARDVAEAYDCSRTTIRYHATGRRNYDYETPTTTPVVEWESNSYRWSE